MDAFSIWHLFMIIVVLTLWMWPLWLIIERTGNPGPVALITIVPVFGLIVLWWLALARWPAFADANVVPPAGRP